MDTFELSTPTLLKLSSFLFWSGLYILSCRNAPDKPPEWNARAVTLLHGSVATIVGCLQCRLNQLSESRLTEKVTPIQYTLMLWSWGYFAFDLMWCVTSWTESVLMLCHHATALAGIMIYMNKPYSGCTFSCTLALLECTNPLFQARWFLRHEGMNKTTLFFAVEITYLVMFLFLRSVLGSYITYKIIKMEIFDMQEKIISGIFLVVSLLFINDIIGFVIHRYQDKVVTRLDSLLTQIVEASTKPM